MRTLGGIVLCGLLVAIIWRPASRAALLCWIVAMLLMCVLMITGCARIASVLQ